MATRVHRIVVQFRRTQEGASTVRELCDQVAQMIQATLARPPSATGRAVFQLPTSSDVGRALDDVRKLPSVEYAEPDVIDRAQR
jgi:hypothetical protein